MFETSTFRGMHGHARARARDIRFLRGLRTRAAAAYMRRGSPMVTHGQSAPLDFKILLRHE